jgi:alpha-tubulin suppressor-like RCC1 family protein
LGIGRAKVARTPTPVAGNHRWRQISAGFEHTCGVDVSGALFCWGDARFGQLAPSVPIARCPVALLRGSRERWPCAVTPTPVLPRMRFTQVAAGGAYTCALDVSGGAWCWGMNWNHESSPAAAQMLKTPTRKPVPPLRALASGGRVGCGLDAAGAAYCWGWFEMGPLPRDYDQGRGRRMPVRVPGSEGLLGVSSGSQHHCGLKAGGTAFCWGGLDPYPMGRRERPGNQPPEGRALPVEGEIRFRALSAGSDHTCGVSLAGGLYCWGNGLAFRFPGGNTEEHPAPFRLAGPLEPSPAGR